MDISAFIVRDPRVSGGAPVFRSTRIPLRTVLASLADGDSEADILKSFPTLTRDHLKAAIAFAAAAAVDDMPYAENARK
ncbi:MAG: DUF433 domain-containing protein [Thermoguttaceae bacterium]|jgi:uncharacterized protein (DUF433 family)